MAIIYIPLSKFFGVALEFAYSQVSKVCLRLINE